MKAEGVLSSETSREAVGYQGLLFPAALPEHLLFLPSFTEVQILYYIVTWMLKVRENFFHSFGFFFFFFFFKVAGK